MAFPATIFVFRNKCNGLLFPGGRLVARLPLLGDRLRAFVTWRDYLREYSRGDIQVDFHDPVGQLAAALGDAVELSDDAYRRLVKRWEAVREFNNRDRKVIKKWLDNEKRPQQTS